MTKKEFTYALERGHGRAYFAAVQDSEKYKNTAIKLLSECISFDVQCEGTRADYAYRIIKALGGTEQLRDIIIKKILHLPNGDNGWSTAYYAELLSEIAYQGDESAINALEKKYQSLYSDLLNTKQLPNGRFPERDNFEHLCIVSCRNIKDFCRIASDIGALFEANTCFDYDDFGWFQSENAGYIKRANGYKRKSGGLKIFLEYAIKREMMWQNRLAEQEKRKSDDEYTKAANARRRAYENRTLFEQIPMPSSEEELADLLKRLDIDLEHESNWHSFHMDIFTALTRKGTPRYLKRALPIIYNTTRCSNCRFKSLRLMAKYKMLDRRILEECIYDCNEDIRNFAKRRINKVKQR